MRAHIITSLIVYTSLTSAWPWPPSLHHFEDSLRRRQDVEQSSTKAAAIKAAPADTSLIFDSFAPSASSSSAPSINSATVTENSQGSATASSTVTSGDSTSGPKQTGSPTGKQMGNSTSRAPQTTSIDARLPAGGIEMLTPAATAQTTYYKMGNQITFGWNYTSLSVTPSGIDVVATCSGCASAFTLTSNASVKETGAVVWDTASYTGGQNPLLTEEYTLIIHDASQPTTAAAKAGYLGTFDTFTFGIYRGQDYTQGSSDFVCTTCSGALSGMERQTLKFLLGMGMITVMSFTWFVGGFGAFL
ncbi:hypothetical protein MMC13_001382 [Lambiella insularis]|nr:hypothetical protein [Lambiella insularis]